MKKTILYLFPIIFLGCSTTDENTEKSEANSDLFKVTEYGLFEGTELNEHIYFVEFQQHGTLGQMVKYYPLPENLSDTFTFNKEDYFSFPIKYKFNYPTQIDKILNPKDFLYHIRAMAKDKFDEVIARSNDSIKPMLIQLKQVATDSARIVDHNTKEFYLYNFGKALLKDTLPGILNLAYLNVQDSLVEFGGAHRTRQTNLVFSDYFLAFPDLLDEELSVEDSTFIRTNRASQKINYIYQSTSFENENGRISRVMILEEIR
ncbi:hypothetical protein SAMN05216474_0182 [Lishizhenia tianjinensis]|uniref:Lipoprotein n=1 Tax=Lishizhenia tianjinensis TaxID=477690 RepID=A0A1I6XH37_9FLAO|nr:hypothetical protein [Lishizhenia tianjinensis]SFT37371.1 hypothetical protein SAMN05216474_0182 [Lishizhenia tianjinensis]